MLVAGRGSSHPIVRPRGRSFFLRPFSFFFFELCRVGTSSSSSCLVDVTEAAAPAPAPAPAPAALVPLDAEASSVGAALTCATVG